MYLKTMVTVFTTTTIINSFLIYKYSAKVSKIQTANKWGQLT